MIHVLSFSLHNIHDFYVQILFSVHGKRERVMLAREK